MQRRRQSGRQAIEQPVAVFAPLLMIVANAVAVPFTVTERLDGRTAATSGEVGTAANRATRAESTSTKYDWFDVALAAGSNEAA